MPETCHDEATLVARVVDGDADAFGELYLLHVDAIYRYIFYRVGDAGDAEDLTEQVFLKAWEALPTYRLRGKPFASWLYRIAHNAIVDRYRREKRAVPVTTSEHLNWEDGGASSLEQVIAAEEATTLAGAIAQLSELQQQVIVLRFVEGLRHAEVARIIGRSRGACRVIQHRALSELNRLLSET
jgi:RNA polymerase sigma-70 factor (ECF subfamily)